MMLAIETSNRAYRIALGGAGATTRTFGGESEIELGDLVAQALAAADVAPGQITCMGVNTGPGGLGTIRDGLAFTSGFAVGRRVPVYTYDTIELLGHQAIAAGARGRVLCVCRARRDTVFTGIFERGAASAVRHHAKARFDQYLATLESPFTVAGNLRALALDSAAGDKLADSGIDWPLPETMLAIGAAGRRYVDPANTPIAPITPELEE
jgi:tRNA threonylcarbamoyl adenosine modification protein YeaZ